MKLVSLNIWGGQVYEPLINFIKKQSTDTDIFCFQEVMDSSVAKFSNKSKTDVYKDLQKILKNYNSFLATPILSKFDLKEGVDFDLTFGQATFIKKGLKVTSEETTFVYLEKGPILMSDIKRATKRYLGVPRNIQCTTLKIGNKSLLVGNLHGFWMPRSKGDTVQRIRQSKIVREIFDCHKGPSILCGDFNLRPDTKSIKILEEKLRNLIVENGINSTRSKLHVRGEKFADYIMTSSDVKVNNFEVSTETVSDHCPMILRFSL